MDKRIYCDACGAEASELVMVEVVKQKIDGGRVRRSVVSLVLCEGCASRAGRTLARDVEQKKRVALALVDEGRQLRRDEVWSRRKALRAELLMGS